MKTSVTTRSSIFLFLLLLYLLLLVLLVRLSCRCLYFDLFSDRSAVSSAFFHFLCLSSISVSIAFVSTSVIFGRPQQKESSPVEYTDKRKRDHVSLKAIVCQD